MKIISLLLYIAAVGFAVLGLAGHSTAWAASALSFFAGTMVMIGRQRNKGARH